MTDPLRRSLPDWSKVCMEMTREEVIAEFGEPDLKGGTSRKYPTPSVFRYYLSEQIDYGAVEFLFEPWKTGGLWLVQEVDEFGNQTRQVFPEITTGISMGATFTFATEKDQAWAAHVLASSKRVDHPEDGPALKVIFSSKEEWLVFAELLWKRGSMFSMYVTD